ncbi:MAG: helix-turn-helix domain-containing protein [Clostridiales bacterium]|nr:helix-turn-helix domain-containing protein [Clostridiales bacterium]
MTKSEIGKLIKNRREEIGVKQAEICAGICSASTMSRIEAGEFDISSDILPMILERIGLVGIILEEMLNESDIYVREKIREANRAKCNGNIDKAWAIVDGLSDDYESFSKANKQRYDVLSTLLLPARSEKEHKSRLFSFEKSLRMTSKDYRPDNLPPFMTSMEIQIIGYIAVTYAFLNDSEMTIRMLSHTKAYIERFYVTKSTAYERLSTICYNLSKYLGLAGRYDECINTARQGVEYCNTIDDIPLLPNCMYNLAWALARRNDRGDKEEAKELAEEALVYCNPKTINAKTLPNSIRRLINDYLS